MYLEKRLAESKAARRKFLNSQLFKNPPTGRFATGNWQLSIHTKPKIAFINLVSDDGLLLLQLAPLRVSETKWQKLDSRATEHSFKLDRDWNLNLFVQSEQTERTDVKIYGQN